jgi:hypothetical protein
MMNDIETCIPVPLLEVAFSSAHKVDREAGVIRSVKILGRHSRNGRTYSDAALDQAARLYEGIGVNIDHPERSPGERKFVDGFGFLRNVRRQEDEIFGDLVYLKSHVLAEQVCEAAERMPEQFGLSHHAEGYVATGQGRAIVEGFERIFSVDIVRNPATSRGLFEQCDAATRGEQTITNAKAGAMATALRGHVQENMPTQSGLRRAQSSRGHGTHPVDQALESDDSREATIAELRAQIRQLEAERDARQLLESAGVVVDETKVKALAALETEAERRELLSTWPAARGVRPRSTGPLFESRTSAPLPVDGRTFASAIL